MKVFLEFFNSVHVIKGLRKLIKTAGSVIISTYNYILYNEGAIEVKSGQHEDFFRMKFHGAAQSK